MDNFDWSAVCERPLTRDCVWTLMQAGCNAAEIAAAGGVSVAVAIGMMNEAVPRGTQRPVLHLPEAA